MTGRYVHLVGSLPRASAYEAMSTAMKILGGRLHSLPDGETGERRNWIISIIESLRSHPRPGAGQAGRLVGLRQDPAAQDP
jgi:hypothetical protein